MGELTRGMLVVDRRRDDKSANSPGMNRAHAEAERERNGSKDIPATVEIKEASQAQRSDRRGVAVVVETPGPAVLLETLLRRVWGVSQSDGTPRNLQSRI